MKDVEDEDYSPNNKNVSRRNVEDDDDDDDDEEGEAIKNRVDLKKIDDVREAGRTIELLICFDRSMIDGKIK